LAKGVIIATFSRNSRYENRTDGGSHCAILIGQEDVGLAVIDCWRGQPVAQRVIRNKDGVGPAADDASRYFVVEVA
jgi:hypothetical protein